VAGLIQQIPGGPVEAARAGFESATGCWAGRRFFGGLCERAKGRADTGIDPLAVAKKERLEVEIPSAAEDKPRVVRVGLVVLGGAVVGVLWPWLTGAKLVPEPPGRDDRALALASAASAEAAASMAAPPASHAVPAVTQTAAEPEAATPKRLRVSKATVTSCRDSKDRRVEKCDELAFDRIALPRFAALENCPAAANARGMLSLGLDLELAGGKIGRIASGKSTTLPADTTDALVTCAKKEFEAASLEGLKHEHATYTVFYRIEFPPPDAPAAADSQTAQGDATAASGSVTVSWASAIIRDAPSKDARDMARVMSGTRMTVVARKGEWYRVKYDAKGNEGWVYRAAIGL
jgi:hypothetical protein